MSNNNSDSNFIKHNFNSIDLFIGGIVLTFLMGPLKFILAFVLGLITSFWIF